MGLSVECFVFRVYQFGVEGLRQALHAWVWGLGLRDKTTNSGRIVYDLHACGRLRTEPLDQVLLRHVVYTLPRKPFINL